MAIFRRRKKEYFNSHGDFPRRAIQKLISAFFFFLPAWERGVSYSARDFPQTRERNEAKKNMDDLKRDATKDASRDKEKRKSQKRV